MILSCQRLPSEDLLTIFPHWGLVRIYPYYGPCPWEYQAYLEQPQDVGHHDGDATEGCSYDTCDRSGLASLPSPTAGSTRWGALLKTRNFVITNILFHLAGSNNVNIPTKLTCLAEGRLLLVCVLLDCYQMSEQFRNCIVPKTNHCGTTLEPECS